MRFSTSVVAPLVMVALTAAGCGSKITPPGLSGTQISYTPTGCDYQVTTPQGGQNAVYQPASPVPAGTAPIHVHASFASDPSSSFAVNWKGDPKATLTQILYGTDQSAVNGANGAASGVTVQVGHSFDVPPSLFEMAAAGSIDVHVQEAHVCGLKPATTYFYKVGNTGAWSKVFSITTAPPVGSTSEFKFAVAGDARNDAMTFAHAEAAIQARGPLFQVFSGDAVDIGSIQSQWDSFFETSYTPSEGPAVLGADVLATIPAMMTDGNHEGLALNYLAQFALPQQAGGGESVSGASGQPTLRAWYSFEYANIHFIDLNDTTENGDTITGAEATWIDKDLSAVDRSKTPWIIAIHHQPIYSCDNTHGSDTALGAAWQPLFDKYSVDLVLNGHVHNYQRSNPIRGSNLNAPAGAGTVYIVSGSVGAPLYGYNGVGTCAFNVTGSSTTNYAIVDVKGNTLTFTAYDLMGGDVQLDQFTLSK
jgi:hypothetical protein